MAEGPSSRTIVLTIAATALALYVVYLVRSSGSPRPPSADDRLVLLPAEPGCRVAACVDFLECGYCLRWASKKVMIRRRASRADGS